MQQLKHEMVFKVISSNLDVVKTVIQPKRYFPLDALISYPNFIPT